MFTPEQKHELDAPLNKSNVSTRDQSGRKLSYLEGWWVIAEANRIFGFDGWTRETIDIRLVAERDREIGQAKAPGFGVSYIVKVRVIVFAGDSLVTREGCGTGHGIDRDLGAAHESAIKEAETDAMKRALMTFGNQFGLALYDKTQENVVDDTRPPAPRTATPAPASQGAGKTPRQAEDEIKACKSDAALAQWERENKDWLVKLAAAKPVAHKQLMTALQQSHQLIDDEIPF